MSLPHAILGLLTYQPMTGYDLKQVFDTSINHFWSAHQSQIYRELAALESKGQVTSQIEPQEGTPRPQGLQHHRGRGAGTAELVETVSPCDYPA